MRGLNKVQIIGHLGRDPEMRYTPNGKPVTTFTVAVSRARVKAEGEREEKTEWFNVVAWERLAEICTQYLVKGSLTYVEGRLETRSWETEQGQKQFRTEIVANEVIILERRTRGAEDEGGEPAANDALDASTNHAAN
ncbi:MAG: single-stranded DNA-binding protein [Chloroflexi bacterium]|nr:single-stranded DNA-binding protein [Chloroflexota bacterium]